MLSPYDPSIVLGISKIHSIVVRAASTLYAEKALSCRDLHCTSVACTCTCTCMYPPCVCRTCRGSSFFLGEVTALKHCDEIEPTTTRVLGQYYCYTSPSSFFKTDLGVLCCFALLFVRPCLLLSSFLLISH